MQNIQKLTKRTEQLLDALTHVSTALNYACNYFHSLLQHVGTHNAKIINTTMILAKICHFRENFFKNKINKK